MDPIYTEGQPITMMYPVILVLEFLANYGWHVLGFSGLIIYLAHRFRPTYKKWQRAREDAAYHKDPDKALARMEAIQRIRDQQQQKLEAASLRALEQQKERDEKKRAEIAQRLEQLTTGKKLGSSWNENDYMPLGGAGGGSYRAPRRSACSRGGCCP